MKIFESLDKVSNEEMESKILKKWKSEDILNKTIENRKNCKNFVFYDGPIYANAKPGIHHVFAKTIKDSICKYRTMKGNRVLRKIGLDTHGLPIEVNVEKKLGFKSKADIEKFGIENFCKECNKETATNIDIVKKVTDQMGQFIDMENPYITCSNEFIESEWWLIKNIFDQGLIYHGNKVLPYCPRCGTELSANEVSQGYKNVSVNTVIVPFKLKDEDTYVLVWTTTPWTLIDNVALCVNPNYEYLKVESMGYKFIVGKSLAEKVLGDDFKVLEELTGKDLEGLSYEQLLPFAKVEGKAFVILADTYVTDTDGTGIVHIAPAYGEDDSRVAKENGVAFVQSVDKDGKYKIGPWEGTVVTDSDLEIEIIKYLKSNDKLFKKIKLTHDYPHCWRCKKPLLNYAKPAWYIQTTARQKEIIEANKKVSWHPAYVGEKRFANWLEGMVDWGISRNRYWGCPMPLWTCDCSNVTCIGSIKELKEKSVDNIDIESMELHRPYIDNVHIKCDKCGKTMSRVTDVMDVWFDSGAMPYAQYHYPFENKELFESQFPADFIAEGVDQTRGWFNSLICISTLVSGVSSYKNVVVNDMMLDEHGKKMSKSVGNIIDPEEEMSMFGADAVRFYMLNASPVWTPLRFDEEGVKDVNSKILGTLKNTYTFFEMYANTDNVDPREFDVPYEKREEIDKWLLSKYNKLVKNMTEAFDEYDLNKVTKYVFTFLNEDLSNWYIRRNRRRFWGSELNDSKKAVYKTTYEVLTGVCKLLAPIIPFITEELFIKLTGKESVHLEDYPVCDDNMINEAIEEKMDLVRDLISLGRNAREEVKIKVRQPISEIIIDGKNKELIGDLTDLIKEELNVKNVVFENDLSKYMNFTIKPNFKVCGKMFGKEINNYAKMLSTLTDEDVNKLQNGNTIIAAFNGENLEITKEMVDIRIESKEGFDAAKENNNFIILNTTLTEDLINEGIVRELVSKVQNLRKVKDFDVADRITLYYYGDIDSIISEFADYIKKETLSVDIVKKEDLSENFNLNGIDVKLDVEKIAQ